jgi:hypothetical protein
MKGHSGRVVGLVPREGALEGALPHPPERSSGGLSRGERRLTVPLPAGEGAGEGVTFDN